MARDQTLSFPLAPLLFIKKKLSFLFTASAMVLKEIIGNLDAIAGLV